MREHHRGRLYVLRECDNREKYEGDREEREFLHKRRGEGGRRKIKKRMEGNA
jgi:hypothetical protein